ncbi:Nif3-like dinuclear metal center hexameric protein [Ruminococcaceae bacterium OttesenSCG-928-A11]|nr:Nif3-like dinuclear metal center hexameric protein [Ruminococcaceae bacterium OttesenSCG-928-A11]
MPAVADFARAIEEIAPLELKEDWDNVGALVNCGGEISHVLVALDITDEVVNEAEAEGCQLIVAHHPVIFAPIKQIAHGDTVYRMIKKGISAVCAHTNLDAATGGVNDILAALFGLGEVQVFAGLGRVGNLPAPVPAKKLAEASAVRFRAPVRLADSGKPVTRLAVLGGSGGGLLAEALAAGADGIVTGEADHHDAIDAVHAGVSMIVAGHFASEWPVVPVLAKWLAGKFPEVKVTVSRRNKDPFITVNPKVTKG